jgi:carboxypeptidase C (cathepsin A)
LFIAVGAPGRSAQYMNVAGLGPKSLTTQITLVDNPNSITQLGNAMFLDPLGSGFSFASSATAIPKTSKEYGAILTKAINSFISETNIGKSKASYIIG